MAGAFGGLLGIGMLLSPTIVDFNLDGKYLFKLKLLQDQVDVECSFSSINQKT
jgi:hypothetical protein